MDDSSPLRASIVSEYTYEPLTVSSGSNARASAFVSLLVIWYALSLKTYSCGPVLATCQLWLFALSESLKMVFACIVAVACTPTVAVIFGVTITLVCCVVCVCVRSSQNVLDVSSTKKAAAQSTTTFTLFLSLFTARSGVPESNGSKFDGGRTEVEEEDAPPCSCGRTGKKPVTNCPGCPATGT